MRSKAVLLLLVDTAALLEVMADPKAGMAVLKAVLKAGMVVLLKGDMVVLLKEDMVVRRRLVGSMVVLLRDIHLRVGISNRDKVVMLPRRLRLSIEA